MHNEDNNYGSDVHAYSQSAIGFAVLVAIFILMMAIITQSAWLFFGFVVWLIVGGSLVGRTRRPVDHNLE